MTKDIAHSTGLITAGAPIPQADLTQHIFDLHVLTIEWYETKRSLIRRKTDRGLLVQVEKTSTDAYDDGDIIYDHSHIRIQVKISPCDTIVMYPRDIHETGRICFEIGNQHIPIFLNEHREIMAAYDANLYGLLLSGGFAMSIEKRVLLSKQMVKAYGNFF
jgi:urease accessory protein